MPRSPTKRVGSDSAVQRGVETILLSSLAASLCLDGEMTSKRIDFGNSHCVIDAYGRVSSTVVLAEIFAHVGALKSAQKAKVLKDILKLVVAERQVKATSSVKDVRKILVFVDDAAASYCRSKTWAKSACDELGIEIHVEYLPAETVAEIVSTQTLQNLLATADAEVD